MKIKFGVIVLILSAVCLPSKAQVNKEVEVVKAYVPQIEPSVKLRLEPDMVDTVQIRPEVDYSITPQSIKTTLSTRLYNPAKVTYWEFNRPQRGYVKAGVGYPMSSVADLYLSNSNPNTNYFVACLNHQGKYGNIENDYGDIVSSANSQNHATMAAGIALGDRALEGEVSYDIDYWSRYATTTSKMTHPTYQTISFAGRYGDEFIDLSKFNYNFDVAASHFYNQEKQRNTSVGLGAKFGGEIWGGSLVGSIGYDYISGSDKYFNNSFLAGATYGFSLGSWSVDIGAQYCYDNVSGEVNNYILPHLSVRNSSNLRIQPYVGVDGELHRNNYENLVAINPYVKDGLALDVNSVDYSMRGGILGLLGGEKFSYNIFAEYTITSNALYWSLYREPNSDGEYNNFYFAGCGSLQALSLNMDLEYRPIGDLSLTLGGVATKYIVANDISVSVARPYAEVYVGGEYRYKSARFGLQADLKGVSYTTLTTISTYSYSGVESENVQVPITLNLKAFAEVKLKRDMFVFAEAENLTNSKLYNWMGYREYGATIMAGVKMQF